MDDIDNAKVQKLINEAKPENSAPTDEFTQARADETNDAQSNGKTRRLHRRTASPLRSSNFILLIAGQGFSLFGNTMLRFAMSMWVLDKTGSATVFATLLSISIIPTILLMPFGGIVADRVNRRTMMVALDAVSGCVVLGATLAFGFMEVHTIVSIAALLITLSILDALESPTVNAAIPQIIGRKDTVLLRRAQAISSQVNSIMQIIPTFVGGALYALIGIRMMMGTTTICFFATAGLECFIRLDTVRHHEMTAANDTELSSNKQSILKVFLADIHDAAAFLKANPTLLELFAIAAALNFFLNGVSSVGSPYVIRTSLGFGADVYGYSDGMMSIASLLDTVLATALATKLFMRHIPATIYAAALCFVPIAVVFMLPTNRWLSLITFITAFCLVTLFIDFTNIIVTPTVMMLIPDELMGKIGAFISAVSLCAAPLGQMTYGLLFDRLAITPIMAGTAVCLAIGAWALSPMCKRFGDEQATKQCSNHANSPSY